MNNSHIVKSLIILLSIFTFTQCVKDSSHLSDCDFIKTAFEKVYNGSDVYAFNKLFASEESQFCWNGTCMEIKDGPKDFEQFNTLKFMKKWNARECVRSKHSIRMEVMNEIYYGTFTDVHHSTQLAVLDDSGKIVYYTVNSDYPDNWDDQLRESIAWKSREP